MGKVLIVDDLEDLRFTLTKIVSKEGYTPFEAATGAEVRLTSKWVNAVSVFATREQIVSLSKQSCLIIKKARYILTHMHSSSMGLLQNKQVKDFLVEEAVHCSSFFLALNA